MRRRRALDDEYGTERDTDDYSVEKPPLDYYGQQSFLHDDMRDREAALRERRVLGTAPGGTTGFGPPSEFAAVVQHGVVAFGVFVAVGIVLLIVAVVFSATTGWAEDHPVGARRMLRGSIFAVTAAHMALAAAALMTEGSTTEGLVSLLLRHGFSIAVTLGVYGRHVKSFPWVGSAQSVAVSGLVAVIDHAVWSSTLFSSSQVERASPFYSASFSVRLFTFLGLCSAVPVAIGALASVEAPVLLTATNAHQWSSARRTQRGVWWLSSLLAAPLAAVRGDDKQSRTA